MHIFNSKRFYFRVNGWKLATIFYKYCRWGKIQQIRRIWKRNVFGDAPVPQVAVKTDCYNCSAHLNHVLLTSNTLSQLGP